jgi:hypothetical protein
MVDRDDEQCNVLSHGGTRTRGIAERRAIDYIPDAKRHGSVAAAFN